MSRLRQINTWPWPMKITGAVSVSIVLALIFPPPGPDGTVLGLDFPYTGRPESLHMPYTGQIVMIAITGSMSAAILAYAVHVTRRTRSPLPILFWIGGLCTVFLEPVADVMGNVIHSPDGAWVAFSVEDHPIPWHVLLCYPWYFGGLPILIFDRMRARDVDRRFWWDHYLLVGMLVPIVEVVPAHYDIWVYYGHQPWKLGATPVGIAASNICAVMLSALLIYMLLPKLRGWRQLIVIPLMPAVAMAGHAGSGVVNYVVLGQDTVATSGWIIQLSALAAIGMSVMLVWVMLELVYGFRPVDEAGGQGEAGVRPPISNASATGSSATALISTRAPDAISS